MSVSPPICDFGWRGPDFDLPGMGGNCWTQAGQGPREQIASVGGSIKWKEA